MSGGRCAGRGPVVAGLLALLAVTAWLYWPAHDGGFIWDDEI